MSAQMTTLLTSPGPNRDGLSRDEVRRREALEQVAAGEAVADEERDRRADDEADHDLDHRRLEMRPHRPVEPGFDEAGADGLWSRQDERR